MIKPTTRKFVVLLTILVPVSLVWLYAQSGWGKGKVTPKDTAVVIAASTEGEEEEIPTGDDPWQEMDKLVATYYSKEGISYSGSIKIIDDNLEEEKVLEESQFEFSAGGPRFTYRIGDMEVVYIEDMALFADHLNKTITLTSRHKEKHQPRKLFDISGFKKTMKEYQAEAKVALMGNLKVLTVDNIQDPQIQGYKIYYDPKNYEIKKVLLGMLRVSPLNEDDYELPDKVEEEEEQQDGIMTYTYYLEMNYSHRQELGIKWKDYKPADKFIKREKNQFSLNEEFKEYKLIGADISSTDKKDEF